jgi:hypothetical protein
MVSIIRCDKVTGVWEAFWKDDSMKFPFRFQLTESHTRFLEALGHEHYEASLQMLNENSRCY